MGDSPGLASHRLNRRPLRCGLCSDLRQADRLQNASDDLVGSDLVGQRVVGFMLGRQPHLTGLFEHLLALRMYARVQRGDGPGSGGTCRSSILELAKDLGLEPEERRVPIQEWKDAAASGELAEVFACGTAAVVTPVGELKWDGGSCDHRSEGHSDEIALKIRKTLLDIQYGRAEDKHGWMTRLA